MLCVQDWLEKFQYSGVLSYFVKNIKDVMYPPSLIKRDMFNIFIDRSTRESHHYINSVTHCLFVRGLFWQHDWPLYSGCAPPFRFELLVHFWWVRLTQSVSLHSRVPARDHVLGSYQPSDSWPSFHSWMSDWFPQHTNPIAFYSAWT